MGDEIVLLLIFLIACAGLLLKCFPHGGYSRDIILGPGTYIAGYDIPTGKADLIAESGSGDFCLKQRKAKSWVMGNKIGITSGLQPGRFRNMYLNWGDTLEINGNVTVLLTIPVPIKNLSTETLCAGNYRFGIDIPPGRYDVESVSGDGQIYITKTGQNDYTIYQDMAKDNAIKAGEYANLLCERGYELWIEGSLQVKLKRSAKQKLFLWNDEDP